MCNGSASNSTTTGEDRAEHSEDLLIQLMTRGQWTIPHVMNRTWPLCDNEPQAPAMQPPPDSRHGTEQDPPSAHKRRGRNPAARTKREILPCPRAPGTKNGSTRELGRHHKPCPQLTVTAAGAPDGVHMRSLRTSPQATLVRPRNHPVRSLLLPLHVAIARVVALCRLSVQVSRHHTSECAMEEGQSRTGTDSSTSVTRFMMRRWRRESSRKS
jgi:hypothetical protein